MARKKTSKKQAKDTKRVAFVYAKKNSLKMSMVPRMPPNKPKMVPMRAMEAVCGLVDPFCPAAQGSKWPDTSSQRTLAVPFHGRTSVDTILLRGGAIFVPGYSYIWGLASGASATQTTFGSPGVSIPNSLSPAAFRVVSWGIVIHNVAPLMTASGMIRVRGINYTTGNTLGVVDFSSYTADYSLDVAMVDCKEVAVVGRRQDPSVADSFLTPLAVQPNSTITGWTNNGWQAIYVGIDGGPSAVTCLDIEVYVNYELIFDDSGTSSLLSTRAPNTPSVVTEAAKSLLAEMKPTFLDGVKGMGRYVAAKATASLATLMFGPMGGLAANMSMARIAD
jgi:hypothetical protein